MINHSELFDALRSAKAAEKAAVEDVERLETELSKAVERKSDAWRASSKALSAIERAAGEA